MKLVRAASALAAGGLILLVALSFIPEWHCALLEHFRAHFLLGGIAPLAAAYFVAPRFFDGALIAWLVNLVVVAPGMSNTPPAHDGVHVRLLLANVLTTNRHYDRLVALVDSEQPDIIALVEPDAAWFANLPLPGYARLEQEGPGNFGISLYARGSISTPRCSASLRGPAKPDPSIDGCAEYLGSRLPTLVADVQLAAGPRMSFVLTHPLPPLSARARADQYAQFTAIAARLRTLPGPLVVAGDFNAAPWSGAFATLAGGLCDTRSSYQGSFPSDSWLVRIPIDHVLVSCDTGVRDRRIGPDIGSDHLPVIVDLGYPKR